jgi:uncharacterized membrane protein
MEWSLLIRRARPQTYNLAGDVGAEEGLQGRCAVASNQNCHAVIAGRTARLGRMPNGLKAILATWAFLVVFVAAVLILLWPSD